MAFLLFRLTGSIRTQIPKNSFTKKFLNEIDCYKICAASLTSMDGQKAVRRKPWKSAEFRQWHIPFDNCEKRMDENSKIIVIDGNIASAKTELGLKIAKEFDMHYVPDVTDSEFHTRVNGPYTVDIREFDEQLPIKARTCDFERFYLQNGCKELLKNFSRTQYELFRAKMYNYMYSVLRHLFNTGQGVVMNRGFFSDMIWAHALTKTGHMSPAALKAYLYQYGEATRHEWFFPHLVIYVEAPLDMVKENIKKRNIPWEVNSPVLTDDFLNAINEAYKTKYLPHMRDYSEILTYDLSEDPKLVHDMILLDLEKVDLDSINAEYPKRFRQWRNWMNIPCQNIDYNGLRRKLSPSYKIYADHFWDFIPPYEAPELFLDGDELTEYEDIVLKDPRLYYNHGMTLKDYLYSLTVWNFGHTSKHAL